jgi:GNAT superfamily N-acetyltransferase
VPTYSIRNLMPVDFAGVEALSRKIYPDAIPWTGEQLAVHLRLFPEGQFAAVEHPSEHLVGYAASLIVFWDDYEMDHNWRDFTDNGYFTNHDPENGHTLYAADVMVDPDAQGKGIGKKIYEAREQLMRDRGLWRIRAGARLQGYHRFHQEMDVEEYVRRVVSGALSDPTLTFQLKRGFKVLDVVHGYMRNDPLSMGYAAVIEFLNAEVATPESFQQQRKSPFYA